MLMKIKVIEMTEEVRYWERLGVYVSRQFAEEYIERSQDSGITGEYLDSELEEFQGMTTVSPLTLRREVDEIFSRPFEEVELPPETKAMMELIRMEGQKAKIIKAYKAEGMTLEEAKGKYQKEVDAIVADALGIELGEDSTEESSDGEE